MSDDANRTATRRTLERLVDQGFMFTALDVSNEVKGQLPGVRHRQISQIVRELYADRVMGDYTRTTIDVVIAGGKVVQAFLYHEAGDDPDDYDGSLREQRAAPVTSGPGSSGGASSSPAPSAPVAAPAPAAPSVNLDATELSIRRERDGSLQIPRGFLQRAGLYDTTVHLDAAGIGSGLIVVPADPAADPLAELDVGDTLVIPSDTLAAYDSAAPITVRRGARRLELDGTLR